MSSSSSVVAEKVQKAQAGRGRAGEPHQPRPGGFHPGFSAATADEVVRQHEQLAAAGVRSTDVEGHRPDDDYMTFRCWDPDGTEVEVFWDGHGPSA